MSRLAIPKVRDDRPAIEYRVKIDPSLNDELLLYRTLYIQSYGQEIEAKDLLEPIVRRFLASDRVFRKFKKQNGPRRQPAPCSVVDLSRAQPNPIEDSHC